MSSATAGWWRCCRARSRATRCRRRCCWPVRPAWASSAWPLAVAAAINCPTPTSRRRSRARRLRRVRVVPPHRARRASRRDRASSRRQRVDQDRAGPRRDRPGRLPAVRGPPARGDHRRGRRAGAAGAERAAEDARGAAVGVDLPAGVVDARRPAADGALALSAAAVRAAHAGRRGDRARARSRLRRGRGARRGGRRRGQRRRARCRPSRPTWSRRARRRTRVLQQAARAADPVAPRRRRAGSRARKKGVADERARPAGGLPADDVVAAARPRHDRRRSADAARAGQRRPARRARGAVARPTTPGAACAPTRPSTRRWPRSSATPTPKVVADWLVLQL